jgi:hypothetical protein
MSFVMMVVEQRSSLFSNSPSYYASSSSTAAASSSSHHPHSRPSHPHQNHSQNPLSKSPYSGTGSRSSLLTGYQHPISTSRGTYADSPPQSPAGSPDPPHRSLLGPGPLSSSSHRAGERPGPGHEGRLLHPSSSAENGLLNESNNSNGRSTGISLPPIGSSLTPRGTMLLPPRMRDRTESQSSLVSNRPESSVSGIDRGSTRDRARPDSPPPVGSCPGDGRCNGTGGKMGCEGCPTYNNSSTQVAPVERERPVNSPSTIRPRFNARAGSPMSLDGVEPGYNPLIAASNAQNGGNGSYTRSPARRNERFTDEEGE